MILYRIYVIFFYASKISFNTNLSEGKMARYVTGKEKERIKRIVRMKGLDLYRIKISITECSQDNMLEIAEYMLTMWAKLSHNRAQRSSFFQIFAGLIRELVFEVDGEVCTPILCLLCFADRKKFERERIDLREIALLSWTAWTKATRALPLGDPVKVEKIPDDEVMKVLDSLTMPCIKILNPNPEMEETLRMFSYNRHLCSRSGIVSSKALERNVALGLER